MIVLRQDNQKAEIDEIYRQYIEIICPFIVALETDDAEYPAEILNEIRAITTHMARYQLADSDDKKSENVNLAKRHIKRAILDCFKYSCLSISAKHYQIRNDYRNADMHIIDNGTFLTQLIHKELAARTTLRKAKEAEIDGNTDMDDLYALYESAYQSTKEAYDFLMASTAKLEFAQSVADKNRNMARWGLIVGIVGIVIGIAGIVIGIVL